MAHQKAHSPQPYFPLAPSLDADYAIGQHYSIGLFSWTPEELRKNITASVVAFQLGLTLDYAKKRYARELEPHEDFDKAIKHVVRTASEHIENSYIEMRPRSGATLALVTFDQVICRAIGTLERAHYLARRGYIFETALVARGLIEQLAWARAASHAQSEDDLYRIKTQRAVGTCKVIYPSLGRLYGDLSKFAHFDADLHHWFYAEADGEVATLYANNQTKIVSTSWIFVLTDVLIAIFEEHYSTVLGRRLVLTKGRTYRKKRFTQMGFEEYYRGIDSGHLQAMRKLFP